MAFILFFHFPRHWIKNNDISFESNAKYIFFYQNYTGESSHLWSLCVEEHFYILLPLLFIIVQKFDRKKQIPVLYFFLYTIILSGILFKFFSYYYTNSHDTFSGTHNRIDGLAWGVLLGLQIADNKIKRSALSLFIYGIIVLIISIFGASYSDFFYRLFFHSLIPFAFYLMIRGLYFTDFSKLKSMRLVAYYSYNMFIWHDLISILILHHFGNGFLNLLFYIITTFIIGVLFTILIEEPFLKLRSKLIKSRVYPKVKLS